MLMVGVDLGKRRDFTAVAVVERIEVTPGQPERALQVRYLERMELGTPYTKVVDRILEIVQHPLMQSSWKVVVDATGVGTPVVDMLRSKGLAGRLSAVTITYGGAPHCQGENWYVSRTDLLGNLELLLERRELRIARDLKESRALAKELASVRIKGEGPGHDDLVFAVALACWRARTVAYGFQGRPLPGIS